MKAIKTLFCSFLVSLMFLSIFSGCGGNGDPATNAALEDISVKTTPKTEYILGEEFEIAGGVLELQYDDGTKKSSCLYRRRRNGKQTGYDYARQ